MNRGRVVKAIERFLFAPVAPARPYLLSRGLLFMVGFDCWLGLAPRAGYYVGGFNVAHFAWLDAIQPTPSPGLYVTLVVGAGLLAVTMALSRPSRLGMTILVAAYSYAWLMSMVDSYQHHYLLSLLLFVLVFAPHQTATQVFGPVHSLPSDRQGGSAGTPGRRRRRASTPRREVLIGAGARGGRRLPDAWAYVLFGLTCAIVYFFTAVTKLSPHWRSGEPLRNLGRTDFYLGWERSWVADGGSATDLWGMLAAGAIAAQIVTCVGYVAATQRDRMVGRWPGVAVTLAMLAPVGFHLGSEQLSLGIGWFSYYMILVALVFFLASPVLDTFGRGLTFPARWLASAWQRRVAGRGDSPFATIVMGVLVGAAMAALGHVVDLPGAHAAGVIAGVTLVLVVGRAVWHARFGEAHLATACTGLAALLAWTSIAQSEVRFDYYRLVAGAHRRQSHWEAALDAYVKANRYAPAGKDRRDREAEARQQVKASRAGQAGQAGSSSPASWPGRAPSDSSDD